MPNLFGGEVSDDVYEANRHLEKAAKEPRSQARKDLDAFLKEQNAKGFEATWHLLDGPPLEKEYKFHPDRNWRSDYRVGDWLIELEGGAYTGGRHVRGKGFVEDCAKYNAATLLGYRVLRLATGMVSAQYVQKIITDITSAHCQG